MVAGLFTTCLLSLLLPIFVLAGPHGSGFLNRHHGLARRAEGKVQLLQRQGGGARFSYYDTQTGSAGSCGKFLSNSGFTVAVNAAQMQASFCGKTITITYNGKSTTATVQDTCPGCPPMGLDMSPALFEFFAPQSVGIIYGQWEFADAAPAPPAPTPTPTPTPTPPPPSPSPPPYVPPAPSPPSISIPSISIPTWSSSSSSTTPTSTYSHTSTHNATAALASSSSTATSSSTINYSSGAASGLAEPTGTGPVVVTPGTGDNIQNLFQAFIEFAGLITAAHNS